jgi:hypothetical protein
VASAHDTLLQDKTLQFEFTTVPPPPELPDWLRTFFEFLASLHWVFEYLFWIGVAVVAALVLYSIGREIVRFQRRQKPTVQRTGDRIADWRPPEARARALLADADHLAAQGKFAEAVHLLLFRSIDDIDERRPRAVRPAFTSRDIAEIDALPASSRFAFSKITAVVERSFFGGRDVGAGDYGECRRTYEAFALPDHWGQDATANAVPDLRGAKPA